ncbi:hypothetical protein [Conchiformibius kuhniae]|uniref:Uncharacterized protein n=1 Tax=Conchiformibius kuhniae TaxID=211502 RepID=A0A8T9MT46_9NEIS|nr:hypothetical protein [Conchiformibius kuhniae]UOP04254.1 hypothetical protein LVJ77_07565 [Conchiformibius kuhniae]
MKKLMMIFFGLLAVSAWAKPVTVKPQQLVGNWSCSGEHYDKEMGFYAKGHERIQIQADGAFSDEGETSLKEAEKAPYVLNYRAKSEGKWSLENNILTRKIRFLTFERIHQAEAVQDDGLQFIDKVMFILFSKMIQNKIEQTEKYTVHLKNTDTILWRDTKDGLTLHCKRDK